MSQTQVHNSREASSQRGSASSPYPRENYFSSISGEYDHEREPKDPTTHEHSKRQTGAGTEKNEWIAKDILRDGATIVCPITLHEDPNRCPYDCETYLEEGECDHESNNLHEENTEVELTDPSVHLPSGAGSKISKTAMQKKAPSTRRWRVNTEFGYLVFGGIIQDRTTEKFLEIIDDIILSMDGTFLNNEIKEARELAHRLKRGGDKRDVDIMGKVLEKLIKIRED